jgi:hypothetical protein
MKTIQELIEEARSIRSDLPNSDLIIMNHQRDPQTWRVEFGNPVSAVRLGESIGVYSAEGGTVEEALANLVKDLRAGDASEIKRKREHAKNPPSADRQLENFAVMAADIVTGAITSEDIVAGTLAAEKLTIEK